MKIGRNIPGIIPIIEPNINGIGVNINPSDGLYMPIPANMKVNIQIKNNPYCPNGSGLLTE
jgi:hypothetical protein